MKYVYLFDEGNKDMRDILGGKGANLAEMTKLGLPVPQGFIVSTNACNDYYAKGGNITSAIEDEIFDTLDPLGDLDALMELDLIVACWTMGEINNDYVKNIAKAVKPITSPSPSWCSFPALLNTARFTLSPSWPRSAACAMPITCICIWTARVWAIGSPCRAVMSPWPIWPC